MKPTYSTPDGSVTLYLGDCLDVLPTLAPGSVDAVVTDPPYFQPAIHYCPTRDEGAAQRAYADVSILELFFKTFLREAARINRADGSFYIFCDGQSYHLAYLGLYPHVKRTRPLVWDKMTSFNGYTWRHQHELIAWGERDDSPRIPTGDGDIIKCRAVPVGDRLHPAQKPDSLLVTLLEKTKPGGTVLDCFTGGASTGVACVKTGRRFIGVEKEPKYFDIAVKRIEQAIADRGIFAEVA